MSVNMTQAVLDLEALVDSTSLAYVVDLLAGICRDKADHIAASYQDKALVTAWTKAADTLDKVSTRKAIADLGL